MRQEYNCSLGSQHLGNLRQFNKITLRDTATFDFANYKFTLSYCWDVNLMPRFW
jgi:hypothetical protein